MCFLSGLSIIFMGVVAAEENLPISQAKIITENYLAEKSFPQPEVTSRDPFKAVRKLMLPSKALPHLPLQSKLGSGTQNPGWRLLGVIHGQDGHQAVVQISPHERIVLQTGSEVAQSGWMVKTISENEVIFEHHALTSSRGLSMPLNSFILSFPLIPQSP